MRVYVAGPYTGKTPNDVACNVTRAIDAGIEIARKGHAPFIPHLTHWVELRNLEIKAGLSYEDYMRLDEEFLTICDAMLYLASSPGADRELAYAESHGIEVFRSLDDIPLAV